MGDKPFLSIFSLIANDFDQCNYKVSLQSLRREWGVLEKNMHDNVSLTMNEMEELRQEVGKPRNIVVGNNLSYGNSFEDLDLVPRKYY